MVSEPQCNGNCEPPDEDGDPLPLYDLACPLHSQGIREWVESFEQSAQPAQHQGTGDAQ